MTIKEQIQKRLNELDIFYTDIYCYGLCIAIKIEWGDWKHEHQYLDYIMKNEFGLDCCEEEETENDGSDCYSSIHYYKLGTIVE